MPIDLPKQYEPRQAQERWYTFWGQRGYFDADPNPAKKPHTIMIPLPNVTGALHMGHALNGTLQDLLTRWRRMQGFEALWMPGTDHAGIATQAVVERRMLEEEGKTRHDIGREALVDRIWKWKDAYEKRILGQLKQLGASCDWRRTRFTLDEMCSRAVRRTFFKLFGDGLIYRGKRLVNWDTYLQTAVADDEVFHDEVDGHFWTFTYPVVGGNEKIAFSTTRPETMLGDTAVCVHPSDDRYKHLVGRKVKIPLNGREIPIIADALLAKMEMGTGAVKVTPAHDPNDYACGLRQKLEMINLLNPNGTLNENAGRYKGLDRYVARDQVVEEMKSLGHFVGIEERKIDIAHSDRSKTPVEPYLSDQWFVKMDQLAQNAIDAVNDQRVRFFPARYAKTYLDWLGEKRDWCISRQLWWGHRIPIWSKTFAPGSMLGSLMEMKTRGTVESTALEKIEITLNAATIQMKDVEGNITYESKTIPHSGTVSIPDLFGEGTCAQMYTNLAGETQLLLCVDDGCEGVQSRLESEGFEQDPDVLDTWFSSALWPHATLGWPEETESLKYFYPGSVLVTSRDIITLWVARMVLTGLYNLGDVPFRHVCIHPKILDGFGQTMSKSKGNGVDPMDLIDKYGTDAVRFTIASLAGESQDVRLPVGYECPHCATVIPQTLEHQKAIPAGGAKPRVNCPKCKNKSQYSSPWFDPDAGEPVARVVSERFEYGRNFCNKLWNAARFAMLNLENYTPGLVADDELKLEDRWILSRLSNVVAELTTMLDRYQFDGATRTIRDFVWNEFCDWYVEMLKPRLHDEALRPAAQRVLVHVLDTIVRLLQPFIPFLAEELWQRLSEIAPDRGLSVPSPAAESVMIAPWPKPDESRRDLAIEVRFERLQETIVAVRNVRGFYSIPDGTRLKLHMRCSNDVAADLRDVASQFDNLARVLLEAAGAEVERPRGSASFSLGDTDGYVPLEGVIDREAELKRQQKEAEKLRGFISGHEKKLTNESFVSRAPVEVVEQVRTMLAGLKEQLQSVEEIIRQLSAD